MRYNDFHGEKLSALGFGCMRLPLLEDGKTIDEELTAKMFDTAIKGGVNYFDTAWPYHEGMSEIVTGKILKNYPRESFNLASKFPLFQYTEGKSCVGLHPSVVFEKQLEKCGVDYFDFYLCHNVSETTLPIIEDESLGILDYLIEQKKTGRIRHLGFSTHAQFEFLKAFLERHPGVFEFCQIQLNYMDWELQQAKEKYELLTSLGIPVWVMEGIRGGKLANLPEGLKKRLTVLKPEETDAAWAIRWVQSLPNVCMQLSGMSNLVQVEENIKTFSDGEGINDAEFDLLIDIGRDLSKTIPCTKCRYCCEGCPQSLNIPELIAAYNDFVTHTELSAKQFIESLPDDQKPSACVACGQCKDACPQNINVSEVLKAFSEAL